MHLRVLQRRLTPRGSCISVAVPRLRLLAKEAG